MSLSDSNGSSSEENGYLFPLQAFNEPETADFRRQFDDYTAQNQDRLATIPGTAHRLRAHPFVAALGLSDRLSSRVLDAGRSAIGPNCWWGSIGSSSFPGMLHLFMAPGWRLLGLTAPKVNHAWIASSPAPWRADACK